jgi:hypothetical protein
VIGVVNCGGLTFDAPIRAGVGLIQDQSAWHAEVRNGFRHHSKPGLSHATSVVAKISQAGRRGVLSVFGTFGEEVGDLGRPCETTTSRLPEH